MELVARLNSIWTIRDDVCFLRRGDGGLRQKEVSATTAAERTRPHRIEAGFAGFDRFAEKITAKESCANVQDRE